MSSRAVRTVQALADLNRDTTGLRRLGMALLDRGEPETARVLLERTVQIDPGDAEAQGSLGEVLEALGRPAEAEAAYARALERDPDAREVLLRAGRLALRSGTEARARAYLDRLASLDADSERLARAVQRVGGADGHVRRFTGAPPQLISSSTELHDRLEALSREMQDLTATISANELELQDLDLPSRRRRVFGTVMLLLLIAAAVGAGVYLAVR